MSLDRRNVIFKEAHPIQKLYLRSCERFAPRLVRSNDFENQQLVRERWPIQKFEYSKFRFLEIILRSLTQIR